MLNRSIPDWLYTLFQLFYRLFFRFYFRWKVYGLENIPSKGGAILAVNHSSAADPPLGGTALKRKIWYLGRSSLAKNRLVDFILLAQHLIPIKRGLPDVKAIKRIITMISDGEIVLMFPEGTRSFDGSLGEGREGIGMFVSHAHADVIPCYISGAWRALPKGAIFPRPRKIRVAYGPLIKHEEFEGLPENREGFKRISGKIMERLAELKKKLEG
jgi:1-acyl-sn-glycerol-3-phosphate acyltransferase